VRPYLNAQTGYAGDIAARPIQAGDKARRNWVIADEEHNRNGRACRLCSKCRRHAARGNNDDRLATNKIGGQRRQSIILTLRPAEFDGDIAAFGITGFAHAVADRAHTLRQSLGRCTAKETNHRHRALLRACCRRRRAHGAPDQPDEIPASHPPLPRLKGKTSSPTRSPDKT
jgi:hypothetical protein